MKSRHFGAALFSLLLYTACQKNENATPFADPAVKPAPVMQNMQAAFVPYVDTFYGKMYQGDCCLHDTTSLYAYIYVYYPTPDSIIFSNSEFGPPCYCQAGFWRGGYLVNGTNYYISNNGWDTFGTAGYIFKFIKDSLYYYGAISNCPDNYVTYIPAVKANKRK